MAWFMVVAIGPPAKQEGILEAGSTAFYIMAFGLAGLLMSAHKSAIIPTYHLMGW